PVAVLRRHVASAFVAEDVARVHRQVAPAVAGVAGRRSAVTPALRGGAAGAVFRVVAARLGIHRIAVVARLLARFLPGFRALLILGLRAALAVFLLALARLRRRVLALRGVAFLSAERIRARLSGSRLRLRAFAL